jgi:hypothetical protein
MTVVSVARTLSTTEEQRQTQLVWFDEKVMGKKATTVKKLPRVQVQIEFFCSSETKNGRRMTSGTKLFDGGDLRTKTTTPKSGLSFESR